MKTIYFINQYGSTPETGIHQRHHHFADILGQQGYRVFAISAQWHHLLNAHDPSEPLATKEERENYTVIRIPAMRYAHAHDKRRVLNWLLFGWHLRRIDKVIGHTPDVIVYSSPSLLPFWGAQRLARRLKVPLAFEVRDIWPLTLMELGGINPRHPLIRVMQRTEDRAYATADAVISNLKNAVLHMQTRGLDAQIFTWIPNGYDMEEVAETTPLAPEIATLLPEGKFLVGYTGTVGESNAIDTMVLAAERLKDNQDIAFVVVGRGKNKARIEEMIAHKELSNIHVLPAIPKAQVNTMLARFDVCYIGLTRDPLFRFGVSPNKLFDYLAAAKPILYAIDSGAYTPVADAECGRQIPPADSEALAKAVLEMQALPLEQLAEMGRRGHALVAQEHDYRKLATRLETTLRALCKDASKVERDK